MILFGRTGQGEISYTTITFVQLHLIVAPPTPLSLPPLYLEINISQELSSFGGKKFQVMFSVNNSCLIVQF